MIKFDTAIFDVCNTLYDSNTTYDYIKYVVSRYWLRRNLLRLLVNKNSPLFYLLLLLNKTFNIDSHKYLSVLLLRGLPKDHLIQQAQKFYKSFLSKKEILHSHNLLESLKLNGVNIILISASIDPIVNVISKELRVSSHSSTLSYRNGIANGLIANDITGNKVQFLNDIDCDNLMVVTDNRSDFELMQKARYRTAVVYNSRDKIFWSKLNPDFIEI